MKIRWPADEKTSYIPLRTKSGRAATHSRQVALVLAKAMLQHRLKDAAELPPPPARLEALATEYARDHPGRQGAFNASVVRRFASVTGCASVAGLTATALREYLHGLREQGRQSATQLNHLSALSAFCQWLVTSDRLAANPAKHVQRPKLFRPSPRGLSDATRAALLDKARKAGAELEVSLGLNTGLRLGELMHLRWSDVGKKAITVGSESFTPKGKRIRRVPVNAELAKVLHRGTGLVCPRRSKKDWESLLAGLVADLPGWPPGKLWHRLRADVATRLARKGIDPYRLMRVMGWEDLRTAQRYIEASTDPDVPEFEGLG